MELDLYGILQANREVGPSPALTSLVVASVPAVIALVLGRYVFKMNAALLLGAITRAMTSTAALRQLTSQARSTVPMLGYVGTYAFANVLLALAGSVAIRL